MKPVLIVTIAVVLLMMGGGLFAPRAQEAADSRGELTVPWDEFKKLLNLDEDQIIISLQTFQKLLVQTGAKTVPAHSLQNGNVVMTRAAFGKLIDQMKPPVGPDGAPPFDYLITKAVYSGNMQKNTTAFMASFTVHVLKKDAFLKVPILYQHIALSDMEVDGEPALVVAENGYHNVVLSKTGERTVNASFSLKSSLEKGPHKIDLGIRQTPITLLRLDMPLKDIDVEIPQAQQLSTRTRDSRTIVSAIIAQGSAISVRWRKKVAVAEKIPPKLYGEVHHLISIEDDALKTSSDVNYSILHSEVDAVSLSIPDNMNVLAVSGEGVGEWQETEQEGQRILNVPFTYGKKGNVIVRIITETALSEAGLLNAFTGIRTMDTVRETGFIGIELNTSAEVIETESDGLEKVPVQKLPPPLINKSAKPLIMGFKYLKHPYNLVLDIKKHEKIGVPIAAINSASIVTLFTEDGKIVHRLVYQVRNSAKQFLEIQLPEKSDVWSVFVSNQPVESSVNGKGKLLVPLIRSRSVNNRLDTFPVEIIYCVVQDRFSNFGAQESHLPAVDLLTSQLIWSVYLPNDYAYVHFNSTLEKEEIIRGLNVLTGARRQYNEKAMKEIGRLRDKVDKDEIKKAYKGKEYRSDFRNIPMEEDQFMSQVDAELEFSGRLEGLAGSDAPQAPISGGATSGVLPIQIQVPTSGQVYRFARTIIKTEDPLTFSVVYTRMWVLSLLKWITSLLVLWIFYLNRQHVARLWRWLGGNLRKITEVIRRHEGTTRRYARSGMTPFVLFGLGVVFWFITGLLSAVFFFLFWVSLVHQVIMFAKKRAHTKTGSEGQAG
jgi:hypothetical protein